MASSAIITTAAIATVTSTTTVLVLMSALDGHTTFFSSLFVSRKNYNTTKNKKNNPDRLELKKYCRFCKKHTVHRETK